MDEKVVLARIAMQANRYEDMLCFIKEALLLHPIVKISQDMIEIIQAVFKKYISKERAAIRTVSVISRNQKFIQYTNGLSTYQNRIETQLFEKCKSINQTITE